MNKRKGSDELLRVLTAGLSDEDLAFADIASDLAVQITLRREELGMTQAELAKMLGKSQTTISKWENGDCNFQLKTLIEIALKLDMPLTVSLREQHKACDVCFAHPPAADVRYVVGVSWSALPANMQKCG